LHPPARLNDFYTNTMSAIELQNVTKIFRRGFRGTRITAIRDLSFVIGAGELVGFAGPNGAGKTTTIKLIMGLARPTGGTVRVHGRPSSDPRCRGRIVFVSEQPYFYSHLNVSETLRFHARLRGIDSRASDGEIERVLSAVGLDGKERMAVRQLSKGQQQRLNLGQALLGESDVYILDEPLSGLDPPGRSLFRSVFRRLHEQGRTVFYSTHILEDIESFCDRVIVLSAGSLQYDGGIGPLLDRGFQGTELHYPALSGPTQAALRAAGYTVETPAPDRAVVFAGRQQSPETVQRLLAREGMFPVSVSRRVTSLEQLLYGRNP